MTCSIFAVATRTVISTLAAFVLAAALPKAALADASDVGIWKVDPVKSKFDSRSATLTIERVRGANQAAGRFIAISRGGSVFLVTKVAVGDSKGVQPVAYAQMVREGKAVLIGSNARGSARCFQCEASRPDSRLTLTFDVAYRAEQQINDMLAKNQE